jgi:hypothetical protein
MTKILWSSQIVHVYDIFLKHHKKIVIDEKLSCSDRTAPSRTPTISPSSPLCALVQGSHRRLLPSLLNRPLNSARRLPRSPLKPVVRLAPLVIQPLIRIYRDPVVVTHSRWAAACPPLAKMASALIVWAGSSPTTVPLFFFFQNVYSFK